VNYTIIIPAWNEAAYITATFSSMAEAKAARSYAGRVVVVDNISDDNTADLARAADATVVFEPINQIAAARNASANCLWRKASDSYQA